MEQQDTIEERPVKTTVMYIEPQYAVLFLGQQNPLNIDDTNYVDDLVVEIGRNHFFFTSNRATLALNSQIEAGLLLNGQHYVTLALPRALSYHAINNTINRQMVYNWLARLTRRGMRALAQQQDDQLKASAVVAEMISRRDRDQEPAEVEASEEAVAIPA